MLSSTTSLHTMKAHDGGLLIEFLYFQLPQSSIACEDCYLLTYTNLLTYLLNIFSNFQGRSQNK